jgi:16S rRNA (guanine(966)-N(2))-methyltransferase RsmD
MKKYIRIVGGQYRRTLISVVEAPGLRPTPDRVRETLFNWLAFFWQNQFSSKNVLDLFAGSGALGFEAASRGVASVQMVECHTQTIAALRHLRDKLKAVQVSIHPGDAKSMIAKLDQARFDLILLDPPFGQNWFPAVLNQVSPLLNQGGLVYVEAETLFEPPVSFETLRTGHAGAVYYQLLQKKPSTI